MSAIDPASAAQEPLAGVMLDTLIAAYSVRRAGVRVNAPGRPLGQWAGVVSPPGDPPDNVTGSDLTFHERAWYRACYRHMRGNYDGVWSLRVIWGRRAGAIRWAWCSVMPYTLPPAGESFILNPELGHQMRSAGLGA